MKTITKTSITSIVAAMLGVTFPPLQAAKPAVGELADLARFVAERDF